MGQLERLKKAAEGAKASIVIRFPHGSEALHKAMSMEYDTLVALAEQEAREDKEDKIHIGIIEYLEFEAKGAEIARKEGGIS